MKVPYGEWSINLRKISHFSSFSSCFKEIEVEFYAFLLFLLKSFDAILLFKGWHQIQGKILLQLSYTFKRNFSISRMSLGITKTKWELYGKSFQDICFNKLSLLDNTLQTNKDIPLSVWNKIQYFPMIIEIFFPKTDISIEILTILHIRRAADPVCHGPSCHRSSHSSPGT